MASLRRLNLNRGDRPDCRIFLKTSCTEFIPLTTELITSNLNTTETLISALEIIEITAERGARSIRSHIEKLTPDFFLAGKNEIAFTSFCGIKMAATTMKELTKLIQPFLNTVLPYKRLTPQLIVSLLVEVLKPITKLSSDILVFLTEGQCYKFEEYH